MLSGNAPATFADRNLDLYPDDENIGQVQIHFAPDGSYSLQQLESGATNPIPASGQWSYIRSSSDAGVLQLRPGGAWTIGLALTFTTDNTGSVVDLDNFDSLNSFPPVNPTTSYGEFIVDDGTHPIAPQSMSGVQLVCTTNGMALDPFTPLGTFDFTASANGSYTIHELIDNQPDSAGTYNYTRYTTQDGALNLNDSLMGAVTCQLHMITSNAGSLLLQSGTGDQTVSDFAVVSIGGVNESGGGSHQVPTSGLTAKITSPTPSAALVGSKGTATVLITNTGSTRYHDLLGIGLYVSSTPSIIGGTSVLSERPTLALKPGASKAMKLHFVYPNRSDGNYYLVVQLTAADGSTDSASASTVRLAQPFVDLTGSISTPTAVHAGKPTTAPLTIQNVGNVPASGPLDIDLFASTGTIIDTSAVPLGTVTTVLKLKPSSSKTTRLRLSLPTLAVAQYHLIARLRWMGAPADENSNETLTSGGTFAVSEPPAAAGLQGVASAGLL